MSELQLWERQQGEGARAFQAFVTYRDIDVERTLEKVRTKLGKSRTLIERWSRVWRWVLRVEAYDRLLDREKVKLKLKEQQEMLERHASIASAFQSQVVLRLNELVITGKVAELTPSEMAKWLEVSVKIERLSRGLPSEVLQQDIEDKSKTQIPWASLPLEKKLALRETMKTLLGVRLL